MDVLGRTATHVAAAAGQIEALQLLLEVPPSNPEHVAVASGPDSAVAAWF